MNNQYNWGKQATGTNGKYGAAIYFEPRDPQSFDWQGKSVLDQWQNTITEVVWILLSLQGTNTSKGSQAHWVELIGSRGAVLSITGNDSVAVYPSSLGNINIRGDGTYLTVTGTTNTATISLINGSAFANSFITSPATGTAVPVAGVLTFAGANGLVVSAAGSTVTITPPAISSTSFVTNSGTATPIAAVLNILGSGVLSTTGSGNTVTVVPSGAIASSFITSPATGTATPASGVLTFAGTNGNTVSAAGSTVTISGSGVGALVLIQTQTVSGAQWLNFTTGITTTYNNYVLVGVNVTTSLGGASSVGLQLSIDGGATYIATGYGTGGGGTTMGITSLTNADSVNSFTSDLYNLTSGSSYVLAATLSAGFDSTGGSTNGIYSVPNTVVNAFRIGTTNGALTITGTYSLYGYNK